MKYLCSSIYFFLFLQTIVFAQFDPCSLYGKVYITDDIHQAHYHVYLDNLEEEYHDLLVYEETNILFADRGGHWYFVEDKIMANFVIYFVKQSNLAHFVISYTDVDEFAGCNQW